MTLIEMVIAMAIFVVVSGAVMVIQMAAQDSFTEGAAECDLERDGIRVIDEVTDNFVDCKIITVPITSNNYTTLIIQVPVLSGTAYWDSDGNIYWGASGTTGLRLKYYFNQKSILNETTAPTKDYNRDGDVVDAFKKGDIIEVVENSGGVTQTYRTLCSNVILNNTTAYGDINGDGVNDPLFQFLDSNGFAVSVGGTRLRINIWFGGKLGAKQMPIISNARRDIALLNPQ